MSLDVILAYLKSEPLRLRAYGAAVLVTGYLVARGILQPSDADFYVSVVAVIVGVESSRAKVSPVTPSADDMLDQDDPDPETEA